MGADISFLGKDGEAIPAFCAEVGRFYRTPGGRLVLVTDRAMGNGRVRIRYKSMYGLGLQSMWLPAESLLVPAPDVKDFSEVENQRIPRHIESDD